MSNRFFPNYDRYIITSRFGVRKHPVTGVTKMHNGIDLVATADGKTGQADKIMAHTGGIVDGVGFDKDAGNFVRLRVDPETKMYYFHLRDKSDLVAGEAVQTGQIIGTMGATGKVTSKHLHFGIKRGGQWIDPAPYLDADYPAQAVVKTYGTVTYRYLRIRKGAGTGYAEAGRLKQGDRVEILETKAAGGATWGRIDRGWICLTGYVKVETVMEQIEPPKEQEDQTFSLELRVLRRGCKGEDVKALQAMLVGYGYSIAVDGSYGPATENAVECYQEDSDGVLAVDGVAGPDTQRHMHGLGVS